MAIVESAAPDASGRPAPPHPRGARLVVVAALADVALVLVFVLIGRAEHDSGPVVAALTTAWPFLAGLAIGWLAARAWRAPLAPVRTGVPLWACAVVGGMLFRVVSGQGVALSFLLVTAIVLGAFLIGWRALVALAGLVRRRGGRGRRGRSAA